MLLSQIDAPGEYDIARDGEFDVLGLIDSPTISNMLVFVGDAKFIKQFGSNVTCAICAPDLIVEFPENIGIITTKQPKQLFYELHNYLSNLPPLVRIPFENSIGSNAKISKMAYIAEKNVKIGNNVVIEEFVSIKENTIICDDVTIRAGTVIGGPGFYYNKNTDGTIMPVQHFGGVIIEDNVEIQHSCCIDRAHFPWDNTIIGEMTKLDNLIQVAHAVKIGKSVLITSCVSIAGNVEIGDDAYIGPGSTFTNNITIGKNAKVSLGSVVTRSVKESTVVTGNFAIEHSLFLRNLKESLKLHDKR